MDKSELYSQALQLLANTMDPLESRNHYFIISTTSLLTITTTDMGLQAKLTVDLTHTLLKRTIDKSLSDYNQLILTATDNTFKVEHPRQFSGWKDYKWNLRGKHKGIYIGTRSGV